MVFSSRYLMNERRRNSTTLAALPIIGLDRGAVFEQLGAELAVVPRAAGGPVSRLHSLQEQRQEPVMFDRSRLRAREVEPRGEPLLEKRVDELSVARDDVDGRLLP